MRGVHTFCFTTRAGIALFRVAPIVVAMTMAAPIAAQHEGHVRASPGPGRPLKLGTIRFPNSGAAAAQPAFLRGIALLHSYEYYDARRAFQEAEQADPTFALAFWGEAFTHSQFDWGTEDLPAAHAALAKLAPTRDERLARAGNPRERAFGAAVETFLAEGTLLDRAMTFAAAMRTYAAADPADVEAAAFAARGALYVLRYAPPAERVQRAEEAIALAERVIAANPDHPGGVHYLIHATDSPRFAAKGLAAARAYDKLAPDADHALHMPSHIFLQLGMWDDVSASNERAWAASRAWVARGGHPVSALGWHSLQWLQYGYLQQGRYKDAKALIDSARTILAPASLADLEGRPDVQYTVEILAFQYAAETGRWAAFPRPIPEPAALVGRANSASSLREMQMATAAAYHAAAATVLAGGDVAPAVEGARQMRALVESAAPRDARRTLVDGLATQIEALVAHAAGDDEKAIALLGRVTAASREAGVAPLGPPAGIPSSELLGALLLKAGRPAEAVAAYDRALADRPNRSAALLGLARAKAAADDRAGAADAYRKLLKNWSRGDRDIDALAEARGALRHTSPK